jgi:pyrroloquinoline quinone biosynthesis protein E
LAELIRGARAADLYTNLSTGATLADEARLTELREAGLDMLQVSVLDADPANNDRLAGKVSFAKKREAVRAAQRLGFPITLNVVLHRQNLDNLQAILDLAFDWKVNRIELAHTQYGGWAFVNRAALLPRREQVDRAHEIVARARERVNGQHLEIVHVLPDYFESVPKACLNGWGTTMLTVAPDGAVLPCQTAREIPGLEFPNVRESSLDEIWFQSEIFQKFRGIDWLPEPCRSCERREIDFGGCRCQAFLLTGDMAATDPVCQFSPHHRLVEEAVAAAASAPADFKYRVYS